MTTQIIIDDEAPILVELRAGQGAVDVARPSGKDLPQKSAEAFNNALSTILSVAKRTAAVLHSVELVDPPDTIEMTFGLKLNSDANVLIMNAGAEAQIEVKLSWNSAAKKHHVEDKSQ